MRKVTTEEFYKVMNPLDVHPSIQPGRWPYTSIWKDRHLDRVCGKSVGLQNGGSEYFLNDTAY